MPFFSVPRRVFEHPLFKKDKFSHREALLWSYEKAAYQTESVLFNDVWHELARGQFVTSLAHMALEFHWTIKPVRTLINRFEKAGLWSLRRASRRADAPTIITVCNYDVFAARPGAMGTGEGEG